MILVLGAAAQGKREFARMYLMGGIAAEREVFWTDGEAASWEKFTESVACCHFHLFIKRLLSGEDSLGPGLPDWVREWRKQGDAEEKFPSLLADYLFAMEPDRILITNEIGCGIVPLDPFQRYYREQTGRVCCELAKRSEQVWRVSCGLGQRIK